MNCVLAARLSGCKKAAACIGGLYTDFKKLLMGNLAEPKPDCPACRSLLTDHSYDGNKAKAFVTTGSLIKEDDIAPDPPAAEQRPDEEAAKAEDEKEQDPDLLAQTWAHSVCRHYEAGVRFPISPNQSRWGL